MSRAAFPDIVLFKLQQTHIDSNRSEQRTPAMELLQQNLFCSKFCSHLHTYPLRDHTRNRNPPSHRSEARHTNHRNERREVNTQGSNRRDEPTNMLPFQAKPFITRHHHRQHHRRKVMPANTEPNCPNACLPPPPLLPSKRLPPLQKTHPWLSQLCTQLKHATNAPNHQRAHPTSFGLARPTDRPVTAIV